MISKSLAANTAQFRSRLISTIICTALYALIISPSTALPLDMIPVNPERSPDRLLSDFLSDSERASGDNLPTVAVAGRVGGASFQDINIQLRRGDYNGIIERARSVLATEPSSGLAYEIIGTAEVMLGRSRRAVDALQKATEVEANQNGPWTKLGSLQMDAGDVELAATSLHRAIEIDSSDRFAHQRLGLLYEYKGDAARAIHHFQEGLVGTDPSYLGVAVNLARQLNRINQQLRAVRSLEPRLPIDSTILEAHLVLAAAYLGVERYREAGIRFDRVSALDPDREEARLGKALALRGDGDAAAALEILDDLVSENPESIPAIATYGETLLAMDRLEEADAAFDRYINLGGDPSYARKRLALYHLDRSQFGEARTIYEELVASGSGDPDVFARLSELYLADGAPADGEKILRDGVKQFPKNAYLKLRLGSFLAALGRYAQATTELRAAQRLAPNDTGVLKALSMVQSRTGDTSGALETAGKLYTLARQSDVAAFYASRLVADGQVAAAKRVYREVLAEYPNNALALNNLADLLGDTGELREAEELARKATAQFRDNSDLLDTLGWILYRRGEFDEAAKTLAQASTYSPNSASIRYHHGVALSSLGRDREAKEELSEALRLGPDADWASDAKTRLANN